MLVDLHCHWHYNSGIAIVHWHIGIIIENHCIDPGNKEERKKTCILSGKEGGGGHPHRQKMQFFVSKLKKCLKYSEVKEYACEFLEGYP